MIDVIVAIGIATFGIVYMVKFTDGPFDLFFKLRRFLSMGDPYDPEQELPEKLPPVRLFFYQMFDCFWCLSTWVSLALLLIYAFAIKDFHWLLIIYWFGAVGVSGVLWIYAFTHGAGETDDG